MPKNILYAEDNPDDLMIFKLAFKRGAVSHTLHSAEDGEVAIAWLAGEGRFSDRVKYPLPDLLILDLKMPRKNGFDVMEWLKKSGRTDLPVVVLSSSDDPRDVKHAQELGASRYMMKTATCKEIIDHIKSI